MKKGKKSPMALLKVSWIDDGVIGPCRVQCTCGNILDFEMLSDGDVVECSSCSVRTIFHQQITFSFSDLSPKKKTQGES